MKKVIIIGATSGIGKELAIIFANNNYKVGITGRRKKELEKLENSNHESYVISSFDCSIDNNSKRLNDLSDKMGGVDILILSSGRGDININLDFDIENKTNQLNVIAFTEIVDWAFNYFEKQNKGHIVAISSIAGIRGNGTAPAYNASKAYQINYLEGLRQKAYKTGKPIYITDIRPGFVDTDMAKGDGLFWVATPQKAGKQIFRIIKRKKIIGYVTKRWKVIALILRIIPQFIYKRM